MGGSPAKSTAHAPMPVDIRTLYQAVERIEDHAATKNRLLDILHSGYNNAPHGSALRATIEREIAREIADLGSLHAQRDHLRQQITDLRNDYEQRGWRGCTVCGEYKPRYAFSPEHRTASGLQSQCRSCRAAWHRGYRRRAK
jgi:CRISPR/Cas system-associated protein Cas10 (large subunit of type III CRISPR-Cas system)